MKMLCARDILTHNAIHVDGESRMGDIAPEISKKQITHAAVFEGERFSGLISLNAVFLENPQRIFADHILRCSLPLIPYSTSVDDIGQILHIVSPEGVGVTDENGQFEGIITQDAILSALLTEAQNRLDEICKLKDQQENFRLLGKMAGAMSHDLNNILMVILGSLELLNIDGYANEEEKKALIAAALTASMDVTNIVHRFQNFYQPAKMKSGKDNVDLSEIAEEIIQFTKPKWRDEALRKGKKIELQLDLHPAPLVHGNAGEIREVITNLILNSIEAITVNGIIRIKVYPRDNFAVVEVSDNGIGMNEEQRKRCFEPFFTTKANADGTGIGLSICGDIIHEHSGRIELDSSPDKGTSFRIYFPASDTATRKAAPNTANPLKWRILLVDDEPEVRAVIGKMLRILGQEVDMAANNMEALEYSKDHVYQLIITDQNYPTMDGYNLTGVIKALNPSIPIVVITGWQRTSVIGNISSETNPDIVIEKPVTLEMLRDLIIKLQR